MADIQRQFEKYHDDIKLGRFDENATLREKRDIITQKIKDGIKKKFEDEEKEVPELEFLDQGSYAVDLGIEPEDGDYDIDEGIIFDLYKEDYSDPVELKRWIEDIMINHTSIPPKIKRPCVTIIYSLNEEPAYHVDLPVYTKSKYDYNLHLAWGKKNSDSSNKYWEVADPTGLNDYINDAFSGDNKLQFKRIVRYMKKWKDIRFDSNGNNEPPSVGITITAVKMFTPYTKYNPITDKYEYCDLVALKNFVSSLKSNFQLKWDSENNEYLHIITINLPVQPYKNIFKKMSDKQMDNFFNELEKLYNALDQAEQDRDPHTACKLLSDYFGDKFPIPEPKESRYQVGRSSAPSSFSA